MENGIMNGHGLSKRLWAVLFLTALSIGCGGSPAPLEAPSREPVQLLYQAGEVRAAYDAAIGKAEDELAILAQLPASDRTDSEKSLLRFEQILGDLDDRVLAVTALSYFGTDAVVRAESFACAAEYSSFSKILYTRSDIYQAVRDAIPRDDNEKQLLQYHRKRFEKSGLALDDAKRSELTAALSTVSGKEKQFNKNIADDQTVVEFTTEELAGVPQDYLDSFAKTADGTKYALTPEYQNYAGVVKYAQSAATRQKMMLAYHQVGGSANIALLSEAIDARRKIANLAGYATWGDYQTDGRMAGTAQTAMDMLNGLKTQLTPRFNTDMQKIREAKEADVGGAATLDSWDVPYYANKIKLRDYSYDTEALKEYFPLDGVLDGLFAICGELFGIQIEEVKDAVVWDKAVKLYVTRDRASLSILGYFYLDLYPREGKDNWFSTGALLNTRLLGDGTFQKPVAIFLGNFVPRINDQPPLLEQYDVETVFHEFGHVLHVILSRVPYSSLSGYNIPWDYAELPSQMLQFFARDRLILSRVSGHYQDRSKKIPEAMLNQLVSANTFNLGYGYAMQIWQSMLDMTLHTSDIPLDPTATCNATFKDFLGMELPAGDLFMAGFGHLMDGYDAGYYGYIWAEVYAWDVLAEFQKTNFASPAVGKRYREAILERGAIRNPAELLRDFLGRQSDDAAFRKWLGI